MDSNAVYVRIWNDSSAPDLWFARLLDNSITSEGGSIGQAMDAMTAELERRPSYYAGRPVVISSIRTRGSQD